MMRTNWWMDQVDMLVVPAKACRGSRGVKGETMMVCCYIPADAY